MTAAASSSGPFPATEHGDVIAFIFLAVLLTADAVATALPYPAQGSRRQDADSEPAQE
jgi:hypothetical protein